MGRFQFRSSKLCFRVRRARAIQLSHLTTKFAVWILLAVHYPSEAVAINTSSPVIIMQPYLYFGGLWSQQTRTLRRNMCERVNYVCTVLIPVFWPKRYVVALQCPFREPWLTRIVKSVFPATLQTSRRYGLLLRGIRKGEYM